MAALNEATLGPVLVSSATVPRPKLAPSAPEDVSSPLWLSARGKEIFGDIVEKMRAANVTVVQLHSYTIAMAAYHLAMVESLLAVGVAKGAELSPELGRLVARHLADAERILDKLCANPKAGQQAGIKPPVKKKMGIIESLLAAKQQRDG